MAEARPPLPAGLRRDVLFEAGHRCAIPTCRHTTVEVAHIVPWAEVKTHEFANLIALCPNCHTTYDSGRIDRQSMLRYKSNLALLGSRYSDVERRVLEYFALHPDQREVWLPGGMNLFVMYLLRDGYLEAGQTLTARAQASHIFAYETVVSQRYQLTDPGRAFVKNWAEARSLET
jgi:hypothetical protein